MITVKLTITDPTGNTDKEHTRELPCKYEVCWRCEGRGSHVNPAIDENGISPEEFVEDPDFEEAYFSGQYDVSCEECRGQRVLPTPDPELMTSSQRRFFRLWEMDQAQEAEYKRESAFERKHGY